MSTNSLLSSLYGGGGSGGYSNTTTRSSSLFTKQYSFMGNLQSSGAGDHHQRARPSSVSKMIENSSPNELMRWTPLIKTVHKLTAKIKKDYFFFWCRMEAYVKARNKLKGMDKENVKEMSNIKTNDNAHINKIEEQKQPDSQKSIESMPVCQNTTPLLSKSQNDQIKVMPNLIAIEDINLPIVEAKKSSPNVLSQQKQPQKVLSDRQNNIQIQPNALQTQLNKPKEIVKPVEIPKQPSQQELKANRDTQLSNFVICLSKLHYKFSSKAILSSFMSLKRFSIKVHATKKLCAMQFNRSKRLKLTQVFRILKKNSHQIMKSQILANSLYTWIKKTKLQTVKFLHLKLKQQMIQQQKQNTISECNKPKEVQETITTENVMMSFQRFSFAKQNQIVQETPRFTVEGDKAVEELYVEAVAVADFGGMAKDKQLQKTQIIQSLSLNIAKKATQFMFSSTFNPQPPPTIKPDTPIQHHHHFTTKATNQRMKRLSRLYPQQPFLQLPDISQITLFDSVIKNSSSSLLLFDKKRHQNRSMNTSLVSSINLHTYTDRREKSISLNSTITRSRQDCLPISPRFDQQETRYTEELFKKSSSCANITVHKHSSSSSSNLKTNPNTPGSAKKIIGLFSKKNSVQLYSRDATQNNFQSKLQTTKSAVLKKFDLFAELKTQKPKQHKQKVLLSNSKENKNETNKKVEKEKAHEPKNATPLTFSQQKASQDSSKKLQQKNSSSKVVQKVYDMSAKRVGTGTKKQLSTSKKQNQPRNLNEKSSKKLISRNQSSKQNQLSQFNTLSKKVISYEEFMKHFPSEKIYSTRTPLKEVPESEPIFQGIHMTDQDLGSKVLSSKDLNDCYGVFSTQLPKTKNENTHQKSKKLRSKIQKIQVNTARKMKMQIENMINQRKKTSIGILKF